MDISFSINNQTITRTDKNNVVSGSKNYLFATFTFSDEWAGLIKTAQFTRDGIVMDMLLVNDRCAVPWELLQRGGAVCVTVFGGDLITVNSAVVHIAQSGYSTANTPALLPTETELLQSEIADLKARLAKIEAVPLVKTALEPIVKDPILTR